MLDRWQVRDVCVRHRLQVLGDSKNSDKMTVQSLREQDLDRIYSQRTWLAALPVTCTPAQLLAYSHMPFSAVSQGHSTWPSPSWTPPGRFQSSTLKAFHNLKPKTQHEKWLRSILSMMHALEFDPQALTLLNSSSELPMSTALPIDKKAKKWDDNLDITPFGCLYLISVLIWGGKAIGHGCRPPLKILLRFLSLPQSTFFQIRQPIPSMVPRAALSSKIGVEIENNPVFNV